MQAQGALRNRAEQAQAHELARHMLSQPSGLAAVIGGYSLRTHGETAVPAAPTTQELLMTEYCKELQINEAWESVRPTAEQYAALQLEHG